MVFMAEITSLALLIATVTLLIPILVLFVECCAALLPAKSESSKINTARPKMAVLVPAHNEASGIEATIATIQPQLTDIDRLVVVADNCEDETAAIARDLGATVIERQDAEKRGKGYALDYGIQYMQTNPPDVVIIIDADCDVSPGTVEKIGTLAATIERPVQATNLLEQPANPTPKDIISALAFRVKNLVRSLGLKRLGLPCLLSTGMAFPWSVISNIHLASGNIVEDMQLSIDLAIAGHTACFCPEANIKGRLPQQQQVAMVQKTRWEHGHLQTILTQVPKLLQAAWQQKRWDLLAIALDLSVPPLSLLAFLWVAIASFSLLATVIANIWVPTILSAIGGFLLFSSIMISWSKFARDELPLKQLLFVPVYMLWKIPLYFRFLVKPEKSWIRTQRD
jgi:cellulose synthase/poly-beta-1,6-N-acetylglucosamine synthase-like glycosyltransferase